MSTPVTLPKISPELARYFTTSLVALVADLGTLSACLRLLHMELHWAATAGFMVGVAVAYALCILWVFPKRSYMRTPTVEFVVFMAIGVAGLGITQLVLWLGATRIGLLPELVKLAAAGATFVFNYLARKSLLFTGVVLSSIQEDHA